MGEIGFSKVATAATFALPEASSTPTICRLPDSRRHQLSATALLYAAEALICIGAPADRGMMGWTVLLATAAASTGLVILFAGLLRSGNAAPPTPDPGNAWFRRASLLLALLSAVGIIWTTLPTAVLPACAF